MPDPNVLNLGTEYHEKKYIGILRGRVRLCLRDEPMQILQEEKIEG